VNARLRRRALLGLDALNFLIDDVRDGVGDYLATYLIAVRGPEQGWNEATVGLVMSISGMVTSAASLPHRPFETDFRKGDCQL